MKSATFESRSSQDLEFYNILLGCYNPGIVEYWLSLIYTRTVLMFKTLISNIPVQCQISLCIFLFLMLKI